MLVPLNWLRDYVPLPPNPAELVERLTLAGLEAGSVRVFGLPVPEGLRVKPEDAGLPWDRDKVMTAKVLEITKHPDADKLKLVKLDYGAAEPKTVVTGATNIEPGQSGMKVVLGLRGTRYYYTDKDGSKKVFTLEPKALRGIMNDAMCMSNFELGISDEHEGIIILDDSDPKPGIPLQELLGEIVVELDVLPNMARCLSLLGVAREVAALTGAKVTEPDLTLWAEGKLEPAKGMVKIEIENPKLCRRYSGTIIGNMVARSSPRWMQARLNYAGMRPINNVVDVTNYVMLEYGQPLHAFDYDVLVKRADGKYPTIIVRSAKPGERLKTLDGQDRELTPDNLIIADTAGPIALAGVMGGLETEVTATTKTILLEAASFDFVSVRKTARQFALFSEASTRFSRGIHPEVVRPAALRAVKLLQQYACGEVLAVVAMVDIYPAPLPPQIIELNRTEIARLLGFTLPDAEVERVLTALQFKVEGSKTGWKVTAPPTRLDIQVGAADLIEELARVSGYDKLPSSRLSQTLPEQRGNRSLELEEKVRDLLADAGLQECITYALTDPSEEDKLTPGRSPGAAAPGLREGFTSLLNPISPERSVLRRTLLPELLKVAGENLKNSPSVALYELGPVFLPTSAQLPDEPRRLAVVLCGRRTGEAWDDPLGAKPLLFDFYDLKGVVESLAADLHLPKVAFERAVDVPHLHPGRSANLLINGASIGAFGELHPQVAAAFRLAERAVLVAELDLEVVLAAVPERFPYRPLSAFPPVLRDVAVVVAEDVSAERVAAELRTAGGELLEGARLFDVYRGDSVPAGTKSLAYALTYRVAARQLTDKEVDKAHEKIEGRLRHMLKAKIRGKDV